MRCPSAHRFLQALGLACTVSAAMGSLFPPGSWDSHIHVIDPEHFPLDPDRSYTPKAATKYTASAYEFGRGIAHPVIIQPSFYGYDNSALVDALKYFNGTARGVAVVDPANVTNATLTELHTAGVRGLRINVRSVNEDVSNEETLKIVESYAAVARQHGWVLQIWASLDVMKVLHPVIPNLGVRVVFDHFLNAQVGSMTNNPSNTIDPYTHEGFAEALDLVRRRLLFVKVGSPNRISNQAPRYEDARVVTETIMINGPEMVVYGSDWPHTASKEGNGPGGRLVPQDFVEIDQPAIDQELMAWCGSAQQVQRLFVDNPRRLWGWEDFDS